MTEADIVIVGGGSAGCVLAARLSEDPSRRVLLLEAGTEHATLWTTLPAGFGKAWRDKRLNWGFATEPEGLTGDRAIAVPRGKGLGGSSLINGMIWVRGQPQDYDGWAQSGATGWSFADVLPVFRRLEAYGGGDPALRGREGPVRVTTVDVTQELPEAFIAAAEQSGYRRNPDYNGRDQDGFGYYQANQSGGRRWTAYDAYLAPAMGRANLEVLRGAVVTGLVLDGRRVSGVRYRQGGADHVAHARREVVLAAGAIQSPHLLELSGIGDPAVLSGAGVPIRHALAGVGHNYQDHYCTRMNWRVTAPITLNERSRGLRLLRAVAEYATRRTGILTLGTGLVHGFVRTRPECETPDVQYFFMHASYANAADRVLDHEPGMTVGVTQLRPQSRGTIHLRSSDPFTPPAIRPNFLSVAADGDTLVAGMQIVRRIMEQPAIRPLWSREMNPGPDAADDDAVLAFARATGQTIYHPVGTCRMGLGLDAVVDPRLRVHGLDGLRIADASIMPALVSANTLAPVLMIAEKAADMIIADEHATAAA